MSEKRTDFWTLSEAVIAELKSLEYMDSSLTNYRRLYARLGSFLKDHSIKEYSPAVGKVFIDEYYPCDTHRKRMVLLMIRRLDDHLNSIPYRCPRVMKTPDILPAFESVLHDYQEYCGSIGNKPGTINVKKRFCLIFLQFLSDVGCNDISEITAEIVSKSCLIYTNKDGYAALRQFLRYLFEKGSITKDLSTIVPHYKRRQIIPNVFTPEEIKRIEGTITPDTPMGKRNLAILLLITRMGLRSGDIAVLQLTSIDSSSSHIDLIQQKTGEPLSVFMPDDVSFALKSHIESADSRLSDGYVFHSMKAPYGRLTTSIIRHIVKECIISSGIFASADNTTVKDKKACIYLPIEFPVILRLLFCCGLRIGETVRIKMRDIDLENGVLKLVNTKGDKHRLVPMSERMTDILSKYCLAMGLIGNGETWLFPGNDKKDHISDRSIKRRFERILKDNGIELKNRKKHERRPCLHCMRHVFAFKSFSQTEKLGMSLTDSVPFLSIYLGHDSLNETEKYLKFSSEMYPETTELFGSFMKDLLPEVDHET